MKLFSFWGSSSGGSVACSNVTFFPDAGYTPLTITLSTITSGGDTAIFYTVGNTSPVDPTHSGGTATGTTIKIASNSGTVSVPGGNKTYKALAYKSGLTDSAVTTATYEPNN